MSLPVPNIDDRSFEEIRDEALARIPVHNPEYTNFTESDPGATVLEVFAFMVESMLYRANQVPERNRVKFLRLLGIDRRPATVARGLVTFANSRGALEARTVDPETEVRAGSVPFRLPRGLEVLPVESAVYYKKSVDLSTEEKRRAREIHERLHESYTPPGSTTELSFYETARLPVPEPGAPLPSLDLAASTPPGDQSLWLALLARPGDDLGSAREQLAGSTLSLAVVPDLRDPERVLSPRGEPDERREARLSFALPDVRTSEARYRVLDARILQDVLAEPGVVELDLPDDPSLLDTWRFEFPLESGVGAYPPTLEESTAAERLITWIRIRPAGDEEEGRSSLPARFSAVGVNGARIEQRTRVVAEYLGAGTGTPDQTVRLAHTPVLSDSVELTVDGERWTRIDDLTAAPPEVPRRKQAPGGRPRTEEDPAAFTLDPSTGLVQFGDGLFGARPEEGAIIQARYDYGGGEQGAVGIGAITAGPMLPAGVTVTNPIPTWGAAAEETVETAERRVAGFLKRRDRLVSEEDFRAIVARTPGVEIGRVEVLSLTYPKPELDDVRADGVVTILVIPATDPDRPDAPRPDRLFLESVCQHLDPRRLVTTEVHVRGPIYVGVRVAIGIETVAGAAAPPVRQEVQEAVRTFLSPLRGGFGEDGWPLGRIVDARELLTVASRVSGVSSVEEIRLLDEEGAEREEIPLRTIELPRLTEIKVAAGPAPELGAVPPPEDPGEGEFLPVPVVPPEC